MAFQCKNNPTCSKCGNSHLPKDCKDPGYAPSIKRCVRCINQDKTNNQAIDLYEDKYRHSALSQKCPIRQKEIQTLTHPPQPHGK
ncbi:hypothetical protein O181_088386 [Austropuccinia psidii MF-1]|uniref:Uncharacterized protein n=1 Tax=Austropuccinia psidii MF-1 TaxID=1389203 RepID=A0A9Q3IRI6_9BASI|nr:hypothetical protein [Austropuccinia psidii MF-1]